MGRKTILLVDDSQTVLMMARSVLQQASFKVATANNADDGIALAAQLKPDLILMDGIMREVSGIEAVRRLRDRDDTKSIPILMLSARDDREFIDAALASGCAGYATKPLNGIELLAKVRHLLGEA